MAIKARTITPQESETLDRWQRLDDIVHYRRGRILRLSEADWKYPILAEALGLHVETVRQTIKDFNEGGSPDSRRPGAAGAASGGGLSDLDAAGSGRGDYRTLRPHPSDEP
jgi:hypothetical protein